MAQIEKVLSDSKASSSSSDDKIDEVSYYTSESKSESEYETSDYYHNLLLMVYLWIIMMIKKFFMILVKKISDNLIESQIDHNESHVTYNDSKDVAKLINQMIKRLLNIRNILRKQINKAKILKINPSSYKKKNDDLLAQTKALQEQLKVKHVVIDNHVECKAKYDKLEAERYEYMIRYYAYFDNDKQYKKQIADQEILFDKISRQLVELDENTIHMIMPSKDKMYNGRKGIGFENPSYFCKAKDLRHTLYDERVIGLGHSKLNKDVKRYSRKDLLSCNNSHHVDTRSAFACNDAMNVSCNSRLYTSYDVNDLFVFDDVNIRKSQVSKMPFRKKPRDSLNIVQIYLWIIYSGCSKHMTGNRALLTNFVKKFLGTVRFGNNDFAVIAGYEDVVIGSMMIKKVYYVVGGVDLLTGDRSSNLYTIALNEVASNSSACLLTKSSSSQSWLWHQRLSYLNFTTINNLVKNNLVQVEAARTMLTFANLPLFLWAEAIETVCFTQNHSIIHKLFDKTPYELMNKRKPNIKFFHVFGCRCYFLNDYDDVGKLKAKGDIGVFVGYSKESVAFRIYNKRTRKIHESVNVNFDEILEIASKQFSLEPGLSNLNKMGKSSNPSVLQVSETSKKDLEYIFPNFYDEYFDSSKIMKSSTMNVETSNIEIPSLEEEVFHESSGSFQEESSSSSLNADVQQSLEEVILPQTNTQSISNDMIPNVDEVSKSHNVFNERLEDAYFDASTSFHDPSNVHIFYQPYPHEKK
nr:hypothetical protein [Tanacetum cinerariifolium]